jgi:hypothetical protein
MIVYADRSDAVNHMKVTLKGRVKFISPESEEAEYVLVITGCKTACADIAPFSNRPVGFIISEEDAEVWIEEEMQRKN